MSRMLGGEVWKAISFYFDVKLVAREPQTFATVLDKLFGASSKVLQRVIGETLISKLGSQVDKRKEREFQDWIQIAKAKFSSATSLAFKPS